MSIESTDRNATRLEKCHLHIEANAKRFSTIFLGKLWTERYGLTDESLVQLALKVSDLSFRIKVLTSSFEKAKTPATRVFTSFSTLMSEYCSQENILFSQDLTLATFTKFALSMCNSTSMKKRRYNAVLSLIPIKEKIILAQRGLDEPLMMKRFLTALDILEGIIVDYHLYWIDLPNDIEQEYTGFASYLFDAIVSKTSCNIDEKTICSWFTSAITSKCPRAFLNL